MPQRFNELLRMGLPYNIRWTAWKVKFHDEDDYDS